MKNRKICPKCNSTDIIKVPGKAGAYGVGNNIQTGWSNFSAVLVHRYVCCRHSSIWVYAAAGGWRWNGRRMLALKKSRGMFGYVAVLLLMVLTISMLFTNLDHPQQAVHQKRDDGDIQHVRNADQQ